MLKIESAIDKTKLVISSYKKGSIYTQKLEKIYQKIIYWCIVICDVQDGRPCDELQKKTRDKGNLHMLLLHIFAPFPMLSV